MVLHGMVGPRTVAELGPPIGLGRTAEIFAWGESEVVKLIRPGIPDALGNREADVAALVTGAGVAAPRLTGTTRIDDRIGLIYERVDGPSMLDDITRRPWQIDRLAHVFAELHAAMHGASGAGLPEQKTELRRSIDRAADRLPERPRQHALARLAGLPEGDALCQGDMHPGNVVLSARGPVVIDWLTATRGTPACDVARSLFLLRQSGVPAHMGGIQRAVIALARRRFARVYLGAYRRLRDLDTADVAAWRLPVLAGRLGEFIEEERGAILAMLEEELAGGR